MLKLFSIFVLALILFPILTSGTYFELTFDKQSQSTPIDSGNLQWFFDDPTYNLALNLESADLSKEHLIDFSLSDAFVFENNFPSTGFLFHAFASTDETLVVSGLTEACTFSLAGNILGQNDFSRVVLSDGVFPISVLKDESVFLLVDADDFETCRGKVGTESGSRSLNFSVNFKLVPSAYEILEPFLLSCSDAPNDSCFRRAGMEWNFTELVERQGCSSDAFLGGVEIEGGPPKACDEEAKKELEKEVEGLKLDKVELEKGQLPELVAGQKSIEAELKQVNADNNASAEREKDGNETIILLAVMVVGVLLAIVGYNHFKAPVIASRVGRTIGGGVLKKKLEAKIDELKQSGPVSEVTSALSEARVRAEKFLGEQKIKLELGGSTVVDRPGKVEQELAGKVPVPEKLGKKIGVGFVVDPRTGRKILNAIPPLEDESGFEEAFSELEEDEVGEVEVSVSDVVEGLEKSGLIKEKEN